MLKVENLIKNTPSRLHHIHQCRGLLKTLSNIYDGDICKNSKGHSVINRFCKRLHPRSLAGFLIYVIIKENNLLQYSSKSNSWHFISVSFKLQSYFSWNSFEVPPTQNFFLATKPFGISWNNLHISKKTMW